MQGIGRATALLFAKKGFNVVVAARDLTKLQYVAHDCAQAAGRQGASLAVQCDVTSERDVKDLATAVLSKYENVDVVSATCRAKFLDLSCSKGIKGIATRLTVYPAPIRSSITPGL